MSGDAIEEASPADTGAPAAPASVTPERAERLAEISQVRDADYESFVEQGLDVESAQLERQLGDGDGGDEQIDGDEDGNAAAVGDAGDASEEDGEFSREDLALLDPAIDGEDDAAGEGSEVDADAEEETLNRAPADPEERSAWVPEEASQYDLPAIPDPEHRWTEGDKDAWASFNEVAHQQSLPQGALDAIGSWYRDRLETVKATLQQLDSEHATATKAALRETWSGSYRDNLKTVNDYFAQLPADLRAEISAARLPDGRRLARSAAFLDLLHKAARGGEVGEQQPGKAATLLERIAQIDAIMKSDPETYWNTGLDRERYEIAVRLEKGEKATTPASTDRLDRRIREIETILRTDNSRYYAEKLDAEYLRLLTKREARSGKPKRAA